MMNGKLFSRSSMVLCLFFVLSILIILPCANGLFSHERKTLEVKLTSEERTWLDQNSENLTLFFNIEFPPIEFSSASGIFTGMGADIIAEVEKRIGVTFIKIPSNDWNNHLASLENGNCAIAPTIVATSERKRFAFFTKPYAEVPVVIITNNGQRGNLTLDDLAGQRVAIVSGYASETYLRETAKSRLEMVAVPNVAAGLRNASFGQVDAFVENLAVAAYYIEKEGIPNLRVAGSINYSFAWSIGVSRKYPLLYSSIRKALDSIPESRIESIRKRWIPLNINSWLNPETRRLIYVIGLFLALLIMGLVVISLFLKNNLREKISTLQTAQQELINQSELLRLATEVTQAGVWDYHTNTRTSFLSEQWFTMLGYETHGDKEVSLSESGTYIHPDDLPTVSQSFREYIAGGGTGQIEQEVRLRRADGTWCWVFSKGKAVLWDEKGVPLRIIGLYVNIQTLKDAREKMDQSETKFRAIFENAPYSIVINNPADGRYLEANKKFLENRGISKEDLLTLRFKDFALFSNEKMSDVLDTLEKNGSVKNRRATVLLKDGSHKHIHYSSVLIDIKGQKLILSMIVDVTEREEAEEALKETEARFRTLFINSHIPLVNANLEGKVIELNDSFTQMLGYTVDDIPDIDNWWKRAYPDSDYRDMAKSTWDKAVRIAIANNSGVEPEKYHITCKDGRKLTMIVDAKVIEKTILISLFDITERDGKEQALKESMELMRTTFNVTTDGILVINKGLKITQVNQQFYRMWRIPPDLQETDDHAKLLDSVMDDLENPAGFIEMINTIQSSRNSKLNEIPFKDGRVFECDSALMIIDGKKIGRVWDFRDISEHKRAEKAIDFERRQLLSIFNGFDEIIYVSDPFTYEIIFANKRLRDLLGKDPTGKRCYKELQGLDQPCDFCTNSIILNSGGVPHMWEHRNPVTKTDVAIVDQIIRWPDGRDVRLEIAVDITERKHAEQEREKLQEQLLQSQKLEAVGILAGGVAHDFNNMLGAIMGYAELTLVEMEPENPFRKNVKKVLEAAKRSSNLTRQLLAFARKQTIKPVVFDLNEAVESILKMIRRLIGENIELVWIPGKGSAIVKMDDSQFDQILINLCVNAKDAIRDVGRITIETETVTLDQAYCDSHAEITPGEYVSLSVIDNGCGMDKETLSHVFEPFFTTKELGQGTGMGLATVYGIIKQNEGFINVYSEPGKGTTFKIHIPLNTVERVTEKPEHVDDIPRSRGETILIVEDDPTLLELSAKMIEMLGYSLISTNRPSEAVQMVEEKSSRIDLLITDVIMPEMNGRILAEKLHTICPEMKHLFMSGYTADVIAHQGVLDEDVSFIQKPFTFRDIALKIREVLG